MDIFQAEEESPFSNGHSCIFSDLPYTGTWMHG